MLISTVSQRTAVVLLLFVVCPVLSLAQSGWTMLSPKPVAGGIADFSFTDASNGIAVSGAVAGAVLVTSDGGSTWAMQDIGGNARLGQIEHLSPSVAVAIGSAGSVVRTTDGGTTWSSITSGITSEWKDLTTIDASTAFALGTTVGFNGPESFSLIKTTDGGLTWSSSAIPVTITPGQAFDLVGMDFADANHGIVVGFDDGNQTELVLRTSDGGSTWNTLSTGVWRNLWDVHMFDASNALLVGYGRLLRTTDGGASVTPVSSAALGTNDDSGGPLERIAFADANVGFILGGGSPTASGGPVFKTTDGGATWAGVNTTSYEGLVGPLHIIDANNIIWADPFIGIYRTTDGGTTWASQHSVLIDYPSLNHVFFTDANNGYVSGGVDGIYRTTDAGMSWSKRNLPAGQSYAGIDFVDASTGFVAGGRISQNSRIMKTTDGGTTWTTVLDQPATSGDQVPDLLFGLDMYDANLGLAVGRNGIIQRTTNGGGSWTRQVQGDFLWNVAFANATTALAVGSGIYRSTDAGATWTRINVEFVSQTVRGLEFVSETVVYATTGGQQIIKSTDAGLTWTELTGLPTYESPYPWGYEDISFVDMNTGIAVGAIGAMIRTTDGGATWSKLEPPYRGFSGGLEGVHMVNGNVGYIVGNPHILLKTTTGGVTSVERSAITEGIPDGFRLGQNYPNPFNPSTTISFTVTEASRVRIVVRNMLGQVLATVIDGSVAAGSHREIFDATGLSSGMYFYTLEAVPDDPSGRVVSQTKKMLLLR